MALAEELLWDGAHVAHIVAYNEYMRDKRIAQRCRDHYTRYGVRGKFSW